MDSKSKRDRVRDEAEVLLKKAGRPLHNTELAARILPVLGLDGELSPKDLNTSLHDDSRTRFVRVGRGLWTLKDASR